VRKVCLGLAEKVSKPIMSTKNVKEMLEFAKMHTNWTMYDWKRAIFNDGTRINCLCSYRINWY
jgi:hypothetical protein